ncbi:MAG: hypothetical protein MMC33_000147 [Icmadophila ericetorum]|nr:hypothetical protein [Icmadophila ericetorum]
MHSHSAENKTTTAPLISQASNGASPMPDNSHTNMNLRSLPDGTAMSSQTIANEVGWGGNGEDPVISGDAMTRVQYRTLMKRVLSVPATASNIKRALLTYNFEVSKTKQTEETMVMLKELLGLRSMLWSSQALRIGVISYRVRTMLKKVLLSLGFYLFEFYVDAGRNRLQISPHPGDPVPELPEWLRLDYFAGDALYGEDGVAFTGTLGTAMASENKCLAITAGHNLEDQQRSLFVLGMVENRSNSKFQQVSSVKAGA